jgi:DNA-binding transcriptional MerR regulator
MSIGAVLAALRPDFPDVTISKIRFLESEGLVEPDRTPSGYRKFTADDVERLRYVLAAQRDHYLPLKVIRDHLDALDRGLEPPDGAAGAPRVPRAVTAADDPGTSGPPRSRDLSLSRAELLEAAGVDDALLRALETYGLVAPRTASVFYDAHALAVTRAAGQLAAYGIEPRHLRAFRTAADREVGLVEQVVTPMRRQRSPEAAARAQEAEREITGLCQRLHAALVAGALERSRG